MALFRFRDGRNGAVRNFALRAAGGLAARGLGVPGRAAAAGRGLNGSILRDTERRLEAVRARAIRQKRAALLALAALVILFVLWLRAASPPPPHLLVTWPGALEEFGPSTLQSGATVLARPSEPLTLAITDPAQWSVRASSDDGEENRPSNGFEKVPWALTKSTATYEVHCRARPAGWRWLFSWLLPTYTLLLHGTTATQEGTRGRIVPQAGHVVWLSPHVAATREASWDERALPLLEAATHAASASQSSAAQSSAAPRWMLQSSFGGATQPGDMGTYAALGSTASTDKNLTSVLRRIGRFIAARAPQAGIKILVRGLNSAAAVGIVRLSFDGKPQGDGKPGGPEVKAARAGWIQKAGDKSGTPWTWWSDATPAASAAAASASAEATAR